MRELKICIVGAGKIFEDFHLHAIKSNDYFNIVAVVDRNKYRLSELKIKYNLPVFSDFEEIPKADLCFVATPPNVRKEVILPALDKGMDIVCEKPFTYTIEEAKFLINEAEKKGKKIYITQTRRLFTNYLILRRFIRNGLASDIESIKIIEGGLYGWGSIGNERALIFEKDYGVLTDVGAHVIDALFFIFAPTYYKVIKTIFDFEKGANNVKSELILGVNNREIPVVVKISRDQNLFNYIEIKTRKVIIRTNSLFDENVKIILDEQSNLLLQAKKLPSSMNEVFVAIWKQIYNEITNNNIQEFSLNAKTVLNSIELIDKIAQKRKISNFDDFYKNEDWNGDY